MEIKTGDSAGLMAACMRNKKFRFIAKGYSFVIFLSICSLSHAQKESGEGDSTSNKIIQTQTSADTIKKHRNSIFLELLGNSPPYSINYERVVYKKKRFSFNIRVGGGILYLWNKEQKWWNTYVGCPLLFQFTYSIHRILALDAGLGVTYFYEKDKFYYDKTGYFLISNKHELVGALNIGLLIKPGNHYFIKGSFTPIICVKKSIGFLPSTGINYFGGLSVGYCF